MRNLAVWSKDRLCAHSEPRASEADQRCRRSRSWQAPSRCTSRSQESQGRVQKSDRSGRWASPSASGYYSDTIKSGTLSSGLDRNDALCLSPICLSVTVLLKKTPTLSYRPLEKGLGFYRRAFLASFFRAALGDQESCPTFIPRLCVSWPARMAPPRLSTRLCSR